MCSRGSHRLIIVDPSLKDTRGHHYSVTNVIAEIAIESGVEVIVFANSSFNRQLRISQAKVIPVFGMTTYDYFTLSGRNNKISLKQRIRSIILSQLPTPFKNILKKIRRKTELLLTRKGFTFTFEPNQGSVNIADELLEAMERENINSTDHILVHTADAMIYRAILQLLQSAYSLGRYPLFHLCTPYDMNVMPHSGRGVPVDSVINYLRQMGILGRNVFLYAENELLAEWLTSEWNADVEALDIPVKSSNLSCLQPDHKNKSVFRVMYLGSAREEKGFNLLPDVIEKVAKRAGNDCQIEFTIQCSPQIVGNTRKIEATIEKLNKLSGNHVKVIVDRLTMDEYYALLNTADVVLLCYQQDNYRVRGSGIATEAVALGKNTVVTPGTYPEWLAGEAGLSAVGSDEIVEAIKTIANNWDSYCDKARKRAVWFAARTSPNAYVKKLLSKEKLTRDIIETENRVVDLKSPLGQRDKLSFDENIASAIIHNGEGVESNSASRVSNAVVSDEGHSLYVKQNSL